MAPRWKISNGRLSFHQQYSSLHKHHINDQQTTTRTPNTKHHQVIISNQQSAVLHQHENKHHTTNTWVLNLATVPTGSTTDHQRIYITCTFWHPGWKFTNGNSDFTGKFFPEHQSEDWQTTTLTTSTKRHSYIIHLTINHSYQSRHRWMPCHTNDMKSKSLGYDHHKTPLTTFGTTEHHTGNNNAHHANP